MHKIGDTGVYLALRHCYIKNLEFYLLECYPLRFARKHIIDLSFLFKDYFTEEFYCTIFGVDRKTVGKWVWIVIGAAAKKTPVRNLVHLLVYSI